MSTQTWTKSWSEWKLYGPGYGWSTWYIASATITVTRNIGSDTATVQIDTSMTTTSGDNSLGPWQCVVSINGATSGGGEKTFDISAAGLHVKNTAYTKSETYTVGVGVSSGTLSGTIRFHEDGYPGYQGEYSPSESWSLTYENKGTPSQATWSNYYWGKSSTITIQRTVPDFKEAVYLVWSNDTSHPVDVRSTPGSATTISYTIPYNKCPTNAKTLTAKLRIVTYNGGTQVGTWESANYTVGLLTGDTTYLPTLSTEPVCEAYNDVVASLGTDTAVAQYSKINVKAASGAVSPKYNATVVSRVVTFGNGSSASANQTNHISSLIQSAGEITWNYKVTDSRGYSVERNGHFTVINSSAPSITLVTVYRGDSGGTAQEGGDYIYATATATCESLGGHNSVTLKGKVDSGAYQNMTNATRKTLKSDANANTQYVVTLKATDLLRATTQTIIVPSLDCPLDIPETKHAMGIGMQAQASDDTLYVGYDAKLYGGLIKHDSVKNVDVDLLNGYEPLVAYGTEIPSNANLNTSTYVNVGLYYGTDNATVATLSNCPTQYAFTMVVRNITKSYVDTQSRSWQYIVREITAINGDKYIQRAYAEATAGSWTFGTWWYVNQSLASEGANTAGYLKAMVGRQSSVDFTHIYDGNKVHCRLDVVPASLSPNPFGTDGYLLTFMWDNSGAWDTQLFIPNNSAKGLSYRFKNNSSWGTPLDIIAGRKTGTLTANVGSFDEAYCRQSGDTVDIHGWLIGLSTSVLTHENAVRVSGVSLPSVPIRFVFTSWLNNNIAAYAGYGVLDTYGKMTFVKGVANSNKVSFTITYVV